MKKKKRRLLTFTYTHTRILAPLVDSHIMFLPSSHQRYSSEPFLLFADLNGQIRYTYTPTFVVHLAFRFSTELASVLCKYNARPIQCCTGRTRMLNPFRLSDVTVNDVNMNAKLIIIVCKMYGCLYIVLSNCVNCKRLLAYLQVR